MPLGLPLVSLACLACIRAVTAIAGHRDAYRTAHAALLRRQVETDGRWLFSGRQCLRLACRPALPAVAPSGTILKLSAAAAAAAGRRSSGERLVMLVDCDALIQVSDPSGVWAELDEWGDRVRRHSGESPHASAVPPELLERLVLPAAMCEIEDLLRYLRRRGQQAVGLAITLADSEPQLLLIAPMNCGACIASEPWRLASKPTNCLLFTAEQS